VIRARISRSLGEDFAGPQNFEDFPTIAESSLGEDAASRRWTRANAKINVFHIFYIEITRNE